MKKAKFHGRNTYAQSLILVLVAIAVSVIGVKLLTGSHAATGISFSPSVIPVSATEITNPIRGAYNWQYADYGGDEGRGAPIPMSDMYERDDIHWNQMEPTQGNYDFSVLEQGAVAAKAKGGKFGFRIPLMGMGDQRVPDYIINNQGTYGGNGQGGGNFAPDYNNNAFLSRIEALFKAIGAKYGKDPRFGVGDISFYGMWGEWHLFGAPSGSTAINTASATRIINTQVDNMPQMHWVMMYGNSDVSGAVNYAMSKVSTLGNYVGWRNDCIGSQSQGYAQTNSAAWNQAPNAQVNQWKRAPVVGELCGLATDGSSDVGPGNFGDVLSQVGVFHYSMVGNGNTHGGAPFTSFPADQQANWMSSMKAAGYRYVLNNVSTPNLITTGRNFNLSSSWSNVGVAPTYDNWSVNFGLKDSAGNSVWSSTSSTNLKTLLAATTNGTATFTTPFQVPLSVPAGTYTMYVQITDPTGYYKPMQLAIGGQQSDGSYTLGTTTITTGAAPADTVPTPVNPIPPAPTPAAPNLATGLTFTASDGNAGVDGQAVSNVNDSDTSSRWIGTPVDNVTLSTDLGASYKLSDVNITWAGDTTKNYLLQMSTDNTTWTTIASGATNNTASESIDTNTFTTTPTGRYFRVVATDRWNVAYGNSIYDINIAGTSTITPTPPPPPPTPTPTLTIGISQTGNLVTGKTFTAADGAGVDGQVVANVNDKDESTRWVGTPADNVGISTDLGATYTLNKVSIIWAGDTTNQYQIQTSNNNTTWTTVATGNTDGTTPVQTDTSTFTATPTGRYFRIVALNRWNNTYGNSIYEIGVYGTAAPTPDTQAPTAPTGLKTTLLTNNSVSLSWTASTDNVGVTAYRVFRGTTALSDVTGLSITDTGLAAGTTYSYTVKALDLAGNISAASTAINATTVAATPPPPTPVPGDVDGSGAINAADIAMLVHNWGHVVPVGTLGDLNRNGKVDTQDITILIHYWPKS
jgi:hypothetical protein